MTIEVIIGFLGTSLISLVVFVFKTFRTDMRQFMDGINQILADHSKMFANQQELLGRYDERIKDLEKPRQKRR